MTTPLLAVCLSLMSMCAAKAQLISHPALPEFNDSSLVNNLPDQDQKNSKQAKVKWVAKIPQLAQTYRTELKYGGLPILISGAWVATYTKVDAELQVESQEHPHYIKDAIAYKIEPLGRGVTILPGFTALASYGLITKNEKARKAGIAGVAAFMINTNVTHQLKQFFNRHRPNSDSDYDTWDGPSKATGQNHSFPSSHTSNAFAAATILATVYKDKPLIPIAAYSMASLVGVSRIYHNHHWASDVLAGAVVGYLSAKGTLAAYNFVESKLKSRRQRKQQLLILPQVNMQTVGFNATLTF